MTMTKTKTSSALISFAIVLAIAPLNALYTAWIFSSIWDLLVRPQYGVGPSYAAWYGLATLFSLAMAPWRQKDDEDVAVGKTIATIITNSALALMILGIAHAVHAILGWP